MSVLKWLLILAVLIYGGMLALMYVFQRALLYFPDPARTAPAAAGLPQAEEVTLTQRRRKADRLVCARRATTSRWCCISRAMPAPRTCASTASNG